MRHSPLARWTSRSLLAATLCVPALGCGVRSNPAAEKMQPKGIESEIAPAAKPATPKAP